MPEGKPETIDVRMPDGTIIANVPVTATREEVLRRYRAYKAGPENPMANAPMTTASGEKTTLGKFLAGLAATTLPSENLADYYKGPMYAVEHPIESAKLLGSAMAEAQASQGSKALEDLKAGLTLASSGEPSGGLLESLKRNLQVQGNLLSAAGHGAAALIPGLGPAAAMAGETLGSGELAMGLGETSGLLAPFALGEAASRVLPRKPTGEVPSTAASRATGATGKAARLGGTIVEKSFPGAPAFEKFRAAQQTALAAKMDRILNEVSAAGKAPEAVGASTLSDITETINSLKENVGLKYGEIDRLAGSKTARVPAYREVQSSLVGERGEPLTFQQRFLTKVEQGGIQPETAPLKKFAVREMRRLQQARKLIDPKVLEQSQANLRAIIKAPKRVPFQAMQDAASELGAIIRRNDSLIGSRGTGAAQQLIKVARRTMLDAAERSDNPQVAQMVREANSEYAQIAAKTDRTFDVIKKVAERRPEDVGRQLGTLPLQSLDDLRAAVRPSTWQNLKAAYLREGWVKAMKGENLNPQFGGPGLGIISPEGGTVLIDANRLQQFLEGQARRTGGEAGSRLSRIFTPTELKRITGLVEDARRASPNKGTIFMPIMNLGLFTKTIADTWRLDVAGLAEDVGIGATLWALSKAMTKPEGFTAARNFIRAAGNARQAAFWGQRVAQIAQSKAENNQ